MKYIDNLANEYVYKTWILSGRYKHVGPEDFMEFMRKVYKDAYQKAIDDASGDLIEAREGLTKYAYCDIVRDVLYQEEPNEGQKR